MKPRYRLITFFSGALLYGQAMSQKTLLELNFGGLLQATSIQKQERIRIYLKKTLLFTLSQSAYIHFRDSINTKTKDRLHRIDDRTIEWIPAQGYVQQNPVIRNLHNYFSIYRNDSLLCLMEIQDYKKFKDSIATKTKDTLFARASNRIELHPAKPAIPWKPSPYIFTNDKGYVSIVLPLAKKRSYHIFFFDTDGSELFEIKTITETELVLDKTNFMHAGWFSFELYEDGIVKEKNRFFLQK